MRRFLATWAAVLVAWSARAGPIETVPEPLRPWVPWALHGVEDHGCPPRYDAPAPKRCAWPGRLELALVPRGGSFRQPVKAYRTLWFPLPGDARHWPQEVTVDGRPAAATARDGRPGVWLQAGEHTAAGAFAWGAVPESLPIPADTGLVELSVDGSRVAEPILDDSGLLWLARRGRGAASPERTELRVCRLVEDGVPVVVTTRIALSVSGASREVLLGPTVPAGAIPLALRSPLPARVEPDGRLRVQLRAGKWEVEMAARLPGPVAELARPAAAVPWPAEEVWSFAASPETRLVTPSGPAPVDPQQVEMPAEWKSYPAFRLGAGDHLAFAETRRGDPLPEPDALTLARRIWLDFDGRGYTVADRVGGAVSRSWRLEADQRSVLGRAALDGVDQPITRAGAGAPAGIELRRGSLALDADSRIESGARTLSVPGWRQDFRTVSAELYLPPGWRLVAATGVDRAATSWAGRWTLLDFFLVLVAALAARQLWGWRWGGAMLAMLALTYHEPGAPRWTWLAVLAASALARALPEGRLRRAAPWLARGALLALVLVALPFAVDEIRQAIHPVLERPEAEVAPGAAASAPGAAPRAEAPAPQAGELAELMKAESQEAVLGAPSGPSPALALGSVRAKKKAAPAEALAFAAIDPRAAIQTGPGLPRWRWQVHPLSWSGPVERRQEMTLWLASPGLNVLLHLARVVLIGLVIARGLGLKRPPFPWSGRGVAAAALVALVAAHPLPASAATESPAAKPAQEPVRIEAALLEELKKRLTAAPDCMPRCAEIPRLAVEARGGSLTLRLGVSAAVEGAVPVPGRLDQWRPRQALLDGHPAAVVRDGDGVAWMLVPRGAHQAILEGPLANGQQLSLPLRPRRVAVDAAGYRVTGVDEAGIPDDALQFTALRQAGPLAEQGQVPSFVSIERTFTLGLHWQVATRVARLSGDALPVRIELPLVPGEAVLSEEVRTAEGRAVALLPARASAIEWRSALREQPEIALVAAERAAWVEIWRFDVGPQWHAEFSGIPVVHHQSEGRWLPEWRPWPGERLTAAIGRPGGAGGPTLTIERTRLALTPGVRATDATLILDIRSSRGGEHVLRLPEGAELVGAVVGGRSQPLRLEGTGLRLPIAPGEQTAQVSWREPRGMGLLFRSAPVAAGAPSVNAWTQVAVPADRWTLWTRGAAAGPAILFWGVLVALVPIALALGRLRRTPLRGRHWFLLGLGLTQSPAALGALVAAWLFALGLRRDHAARLPRRVHNGFQVGLALVTLAALAGLLWSVRQGLLGLPEMQVAGNGSSARLLKWYADRSGEALPRVAVLSVPLAVYRGLMLLWALWLAASVLAWLRWGWACFSAGGVWRRRDPAPPAADETRGRES